MERCSLVKPGRGISRRWGAVAALAVAMPLVGLVMPGASASAAPLAADGAVADAVAPVGYTPVTPVRICDTRPVQPGVLANQCNGGPSGTDRLGPGGTLAVVVAGQHGVPGGASAAVLNVTVTGTDSASFLTVWPNGAPFPLASNLNWAAGQTVPNLVEVPIGTAGEVLFFNNSGNADVVVDLEGFTSGSSVGLFNPLTPNRLCDTRPVTPATPLNQCNSAGAHPVGPGATLIATVAGIGGVPLTATAVVLNVTVTNTSATSFLTVFPDGTTQPVASNLNWHPGQTVPNRVIVPVGAGGKVDFFNNAGITDVVFDVGGYFNLVVGGSGYVPLTPARICDTRPAQGSLVPANPCNTGLGKLGPAGTLTMPVAGQGGVPAGIKAVVLNMTVTNTTAGGFLTVWPSGDQQPLASDLNWASGVTIANLVVVKVGADGKVNVFNSAGTTDVAADVEGYYM